MIDRGHHILIQLFAVKEQVQFGTPPAESSVSLAIRIVRETLDHWYETPAAAETFSKRLRTAVTDNYRRTNSKTARFRYDSHQKPAAKQPKLLDATQQQKQWIINHLKRAA